MAAIKLTKQGLRIEEASLSQFQGYLPTLQLKKTLLQQEIFHVQEKIENCKEELLAIKKEVEAFSGLLIERYEGNVLRQAEVFRVKKRYENIAGVELPIFENVIFQEVDYFFFDTPPWKEAATAKLRKLITNREKLNVEEEKKRALEKELRDVTIRVNLFEKVLIPRAQKNIKKIKTFLGDLQLSAVAQAKVAKLKILKAKGTSG